MALIGSTWLIGSACSDIGADVVHLISNVSVEFRVGSAEQVYGLLELAQFVVDLGTGEFEEASISLTFWHFVELYQCLLVLVLTVHDVCSFHHVLFLALIVLVKEGESFSKFALFNQTDKLCMPSTISPFTCIDVEDLAGALVDFTMVVLGYGFVKRSIRGVQRLNLLLVRFYHLCN